MSSVTQDRVYSGEFESSEEEHHRTESQPERLARMTALHADLVQAWLEAAERRRPLLYEKLLELWPSTDLLAEPGHMEFLMASAVADLPAEDVGTWLVACGELEPLGELMARAERPAPRPLSTRRPVLMVQSLAPFCVLLGVAYVIWRVLWPLL